MLSEDLGVPPQRKSTIDWSCRVENRADQWRFSNYASEVSKAMTEGLALEESAHRTNHDSTGLQ
ncbi:hypothetical protein [Acidovorax sp.]|uniref:hypothetical protein n=1 Tax=Acidovorax sp. TaxID=1872122 RepID=UPI003CFDB6A4